MDWLGELARWLSRFFPRVWHLECTDIGVFITRGRNIRVLDPGIWWFWPYWTTIYCRPANVQTVVIPKQSLITSDNQIVVAGGMLRYVFERDPENIKKALVDTEDVEAAIIDEAMGIFCAFVTSQALEKLRDDRTSINRSLTGRLGTALALYGVRILRAQLTDFSPCLTLNHVGIQHEHEK
jgi:regulator of protease activity HflC (stomatin/prohibitin superfamily)